MSIQSTIVTIHVQDEEIQRNSFINKSEHKHLLAKSIAELSRLVQAKQSQTAMSAETLLHHGNFVILSMDSEALDYVEKLILDLFNVILIVDDYASRKKTSDNGYSDAVCEAAAAAAAAVANSNSQIWVKFFILRILFIFIFKD